MVEFKGFAGWFEIFKGGEQTDSLGRKHDGDAIIDKAVASFKTGEHEPPIVIGHPVDNAPAWGWVKNLKAETVGGVKRLFAQARQVAPEFESAVKEGRYKKRSAAFYPDGSLRHIGFLGGMPPAVKGLADLAFAEKADAVFEFGEECGLLARIFRRLRDALIADKGSDAADKIVSNWEIEELQRLAMPPDNQIAAGFTESTMSTQSTTKETTMPQFTEADLDAAKKEAAAEARKQAEAEFAETKRKERQTARQAEIKQFCEAGINAGTLLPAMIDAGLAEFMEALSSEAPITFGEGKPQKTAFVWFREFLEKLPKMVEFKEIAGRGSDVGGNESAKRDQLISAFMEQNKDATYKDAVLAVSKDNPALFER